MLSAPTFCSYSPRMRVPQGIFIGPGDVLYNYMVATNFRVVPQKPATRQQSSLFPDETPIRTLTYPLQGSNLGCTPAQFFLLGFIHVDLIIWSSWGKHLQLNCLWIDRASFSSTGWRVPSVYLYLRRSSHACFLSATKRWDVCTTAHLRKKAGCLSNF